MKFTDTMSSFKYMGGALPMHVAMLYYGYIISKEESFLIELNKKCKNDLPKLDDEDVTYMMMAHSVCIFVITVKKLLSYQKSFNAGFLLEFMKQFYIFTYVFALLYI